MTEGPENAGPNELGPNIRRASQIAAVVYICVSAVSTVAAVLWLAYLGVEWFGVQTSLLFAVIPIVVTTSLFPLSMRLCHRMASRARAGVWLLYAVLGAVTGYVLCAAIMCLYLIPLALNWIMNSWAEGIAKWAITEGWLIAAFSLSLFMGVPGGFVGGLTFSVLIRRLRRA